MKKLFALLLSVSLTIASLAVFAGCGEDESKVITVGASPTPHAEILNAVKDELKAQGYTLKITEFTDYVLPNEAVDKGELLANYFQHQPYLDTFNQENGTHLVSVAGIHYEPFALYGSSSYTTLDALKTAATAGTTIKIAIPDDGSNRARALYLLEDNGFITVKDDVGFSATTLDITSNPYNIQFKELEAALLTTAVSGDVAAAVINGNYAIGAGLSISNALAKERDDSQSALTYTNVIAVKEGNEKDPRVLALVAALQSETVRTFINNTYGGGVVATF